MPQELAGVPREKEVAVIASPPAEIGVEEGSLVWEVVVVASIVGTPLAPREEEVGPCGVVWDAVG